MSAGDLQVEGFVVVDGDVAFRLFPGVAHAAHRGREALAQLGVGLVAAEVGLQHEILERRVEVRAAAPTAADLADLGDAVGVAPVGGDVDRAAAAVDDDEPCPRRGEVDGHGVDARSDPHAGGERVLRGSIPATHTKTKQRHATRTQGPTTSGARQSALLSPPRPGLQERNRSGRSRPRPRSTTLHVLSLSGRPGNVGGSWPAAAGRVACLAGLAHGTAASALRRRAPGRSRLDSDAYCSVPGELLRPPVARAVPARRTAWPAAG
jgi:hypothetical protein